MSNVHYLKKLSAPWRHIGDAAELQDGRTVILGFDITGGDYRTMVVKQFGQWYAGQWITLDGTPVAEAYGQPSYVMPDITPGPNDVPPASVKAPARTVRCEAVAAQTKRGAPAETARRSRPQGASSTRKKTAMKTAARTRPAPLSDAEIARIRELRAQGVSIRGIAATLDIGKGRVEGVIKRAA